LLAGQYLVTLEIPSGSAQQAAVFSRRRRRALPDAEIVVDSVSLIFLCEQEGQTHCHIDRAK